MLATISTVLPGFLVGALSVQVSNEFDVRESVYGWGLGGFFLAATFGSIVLGRLVQRIGPRLQISVALAVAVVVQLWLAAYARSFGAIVAALAVAGFANSGNQTAVNMALSRAQLPRLGLAIAFKQSGMPTASMLSGLAVPVIALTVGWRWAYVASAVLACVALLAVWLVIEPIDPRERTRIAIPDSSRSALTMAAVAGAFLAFCAGALNAWLVASGVDAGLGEGAAGLMLSAGAGSGIVLRLFIGTRLDSTGVRPFRLAGGMVLVGAMGMALLAVRSTGVHMGATLIAFMGGWTWPVLTNFGIVRANPNAPGTATGITQMGVYIGVFAAPLVTGWLIDAFGYEFMWLVVAGTAVVGSLISLRIADKI